MPFSKVYKAPCVVELTGFGHGLDCQTISLTGQSVKFYRVSWIYEHLRVGVCLSQRIFWKVYFEDPELLLHVYFADPELVPGLVPISCLLEVQLVLFHGQ